MNKAKKWYDQVNGRLHRLGRMTDEQLRQLRNGVDRETSPEQIRDGIARAHTLLTEQDTLICVMETGIGELRASLAAASSADREGIEKCLQDELLPLQDLARAKRDSFKEGLARTQAAFDDLIKDSGDESWKHA